MADRQAVFVALAWATSLSTALGLAVEVLSLVMNSMGLTDRLKAYRHGQEALAAFDAPWACPLLIPRTDYPPTRTLANKAQANVSAGGLATGSLWRCLRAIALSFALIGEVPIDLLVGKVSSWLLPFSASSGPGYAGFILLVEGLALLSLPVYVVGSHGVGVLKFVTGWILIGAALVDIVLAFLFGVSIRWRRGQISKPGKSPKPKKKLVECYDDLYVLHRSSL